jgi:hypothetical protein
MMTVLRRLFWLALLGGAGFAGWNAWQRRNEGAAAAPAPVWPPFDPAPATSSMTEPAPDDGDVSALVPSDDAGGASAEAASDHDADAAHHHAPRWVPPVDGACPDGYPIKANDNSGIFHVPGGRFYERTVPERCYADAADAEADGYRRAKA